MEIKLIKDAMNDNVIYLDIDTLDTLNSATIKRGHNEIVLATHCSDCDELVELDDVVEYQGRLYCRDCCTECDECGELIPTSECNETDNGYLCNECFDDNYFECAYCGRIERKDDAHKVYGGGWDNYELYCSECADIHAYQCIECGELYCRDYVVGTADGYVCNDCIESNYYYCDNCGEYVHADNWDESNDCCVDCAEKIAPIRAYHNNPTKHYFGDFKPNWRNVWRGIGIELEVGGKANYNDYIAKELTSKLDEYVDAERNELYYMRDGSIDNGFEIITQPHTIDAFYKMPWKDILATIVDNGYTSHNNGTCGLHVHVSRTMLGATQKKQELSTAKLIYFYQNNWLDCVKASRRDYIEGRTQQRWAQNWDNDNDNDATTIDGATAIAKKKGWHVDRYHAINTTNDYTIEHRLFRGTLRYSSFMATIDFILTITKNATRLNWDECKDASNWLKGMKESTLEYLKERDAFASFI